MQKNIKKRTLYIIAFFYAIIVALINYFGYSVVTSQEMPIRENEAFRFWLSFMEKNSTVINCVSAIAFLLPTMFIICYMFLCKKEEVPSRIINLPLVFSLFGGCGWMLSFLMELVLLIYIRIRYGIHVHSIAFSSFLNILQSSIFILTLSFMSLDAIHRMHILPILFPDGNLSQYKGTRKISTYGIMTIFYLSVGIFPVFYLYSMFRNYSLNLGFTIASSVYYMTVGIIVLGTVLLLACSHYFAKPIKKLKNATEQIKHENFSQKLDVISCDDLGDLADNFNSMTQSLIDKSRRIETIQNSIIRGMAVMVESRDNSTGGHINRTSDCVRVFIDKIKETAAFDFSDSFCEAMIKAAPMHDLGKIAIDDEILRKPGRFTDEEFAKMKKHAERGADIVAEVLSASDDEEFKRIAVNVAHFHHERYDGSGYPTKIKGEEIPVEARIMALADVFDALVSKRCYKDSMSYDQAFTIIEESLGTHFDPALGALFIECRPELEALYNSY